MNSDPNSLAMLVRDMRAAPHVRNRTIARNCDRLVAFWDGQSRGTISTVEMARRLGKPVQVITVQSQNN